MDAVLYPCISAFMHRSRICYLDSYLHLFMVKDLRVILFYFYTYIRAQVVLPFTYFLKAAH